jgi:hypothetical protein
MLEFRIDGDTTNQSKGDCKILFAVQTRNPIEKSSLRYL